MDIWKELQDEGVDHALLEEIRRFAAAHPVPPEAAARIPKPRYFYYGREVWESAAAALLCGQHLLLAGPKATGKNVLAEDLAAVFGRPMWDVSMYVNVDAAALIGADTRTVYAAGRKNLTAIDTRRQRAEMKVHAVSLREFFDSDL